MNWKPPDDSLSGPGQSRLEADIPPRRIVLRGVLAAGCSLLLPAALPGCGKKEASTAGTAPGPEPGTAPVVEPAAPPATPSMEAAAPAAAKVAKASVQYQNQPKGDQKCAGCMHFMPESNTCKLVEGDISPDGWCQLWAKKA